MKKTVILLALIGLTSLGFAKTLATVNGTNIDSSLIENQIKGLNIQTKGQVKDSPELRQELLNLSIIHTITVQEAKKLKLDQRKDYKDIVNKALAEAKKNGEDKKPDFKKNFELYKEVLLNQAYGVYTIEKNPVKEADIKNTYNQIQKKYTGTSESKLATIVTDNKTNADKAYAELKKSDFSAVAKKYSIDPEVKNNGGIAADYINHKDLQQSFPDLYSTISSLKKGQYSKVIEKNKMYNIIKLVDTRKTVIPPYEKIKGNLKNMLERDRVNAAIENLAKKANVKVNK